MIELNIKFFDQLQITKRLRENDYKYLKLSQIKYYVQLNCRVSFVLD